MSARPACWSRFRRRLPRRPFWSLISVCALCLAGAPQPARATSVIEPSFPELVGRAQIIVRGQITDVHSAWADSAQGRIIVTLVTVNVQKTLKGEASSPLVLQLLGGEIDGEGLRVHGMPQFKVGDTDIVFVAGNGARFCPLVGMMYGRYRVAIDPATQRAYVAHNDGRPVAREQLAVTDPATVRAASVGGPVSVTEFEQSISAEVAHAAIR